MGIAYSPLSGKIYVGTVNSNVSVITPSTNTVTATIALVNIRAICYEPSHSNLFMANGVGQVYVVETTTNTTVATITLSGGGTVGFPQAIVASAIDNYIYVAGGANHLIHKIDTGLNIEVGSIDTGVGSGPASLAYCTSTNKIYASCSGSNQVKVINQLVMAVIATVPVTGIQPNVITYSPKSKQIYVGYNASAQIDVINTTSVAVVKTLVPAQTVSYGIVYCNLNGSMYCGAATSVIVLGATMSDITLSNVSTASGVNTLTSVGYGFPEGTKTVSYSHGRFICIEPKSQAFWVSDPLKGGTWDPLNVQTADSNPDLIVGTMAQHNELIVFCEQSGEAFYDSGTYPAPFVRNVSGVFEVGCIAPYSIAKIDNSVMWLGRSSTGYGIIYRLNGYTPERLSTYSIEFAIQQMGDVTDAIAFTYQQDGHHFYVITFPTGNKTFVYDINTGLWHERAGFINGAFTRWEAQEYAYFDSKHLVCDTLEGKIYSLDMSGYSDGGAIRKWVRSFRVPTGSMLRTVHHKLALEFEVVLGLLVARISRLR